MSNNDLKFTLRFNAETKSFVGEVKAANFAVDGLGDQATTTGRQLDTMNQRSSSLSGELGSLRGQLLGLAGGFSALYAAQRSIDTLATYQDTRTRIQALVETQDAWIETEEYLISVSKEHNKSMLDMSDSLSRLLVLEKSGLITHRQTTALFEGMSNAASRNGASSADLGRVMYGLQQAMASGTVRAEEFNQVMEPIPDLVISMEKAAGVASGGFRRMVNDGEVTSKFFAETLVKALESYEGAAAATADNINAKQNQVITSYTEMVAAFEAPISDSYVTVLDGLASSMDVVAENAELLSDAVGVTLAVAMGRGTAAVAALTRAKLTKIASDRQDLAATIAGQQATVNATTAEVHRLEVMQLSNNQKFRAIGAESALTAAKAKLKVQTDLLAASQARANMAARTGNALMGLMGGPAGVVMMAAGALAYFGTQAQTSSIDTNDLKLQVDALLGRMEKVREVRLEEAIEKQKKAIAQLSDEYRKTALAPAPTQNIWQRLTESNSEMRERQVKESKESAVAISQVQLELQQANADLIELEKRLAESRENRVRQKTSGDDKPKVNQSADKQAQRTLANLERQVEMYGITSHAAKMRYDVEEGALKEINTGMKQQLIAQAELLDKQEAAKKSQSALESFQEQTDELTNAYQMRLAIQADMENKAAVEENYAYAERLENLTNHYQTARTLLKDNQEQIAALDQEYYNTKEMLRAEHEMNLTDIEREAQEQREEQNKDYWQRYLESAERNLSNFNELSESTINSFSSGMGNAFEKMIFDSQSLGDALENMAMGMARSFVNALGQMLAQWLAYQAVQKLTGMQTQSAAATAMSANAQAASIQAGINAFSSTAAIPIVGPGMAPAAMSAALAVTTPMAASVSALAFSGMLGQAHDGINRVPRENEGTWLLKANEMVLNPAQADNFRWMVEMMQQMKTIQAGAMTAAAGSLASGGMPVSINVSGVNRSQVQANAQVKDGELQIDMIIDQAVNQSMSRMYEDADNGGPISTKIRQG